LTDHFIAERIVGYPYLDSITIQQTSVFIETINVADSIIWCLVVDLSM